MIDRGIILRTEIGEFIEAEHNRYRHKLTSSQRAEPKSQDSLSLNIFNNPMMAEDWATLTEYHRLLEPFVDVTMQLQGLVRTKRFFGVGHVIPTLEYILAELEEAKTRFEYNPEKHYLAAVEQAWSKANEYYEKLDDSPVYVAGVVLDPRWKWKYFREQWKDNPHWISRAGSQLRGLWESEYKTLNIQQISPKPFLDALPSGEPHSRMGRVFQQIQRMVIPESDKEEDDDKYDIWIAEKPTLVDPLQYWRNPTIQRAFPRLSRMALDVFSIPCMSDEPERIFSLAGLLIDKRRSRLGCELIQASECLGHWDRNGFTQICMDRNPLQPQFTDSDEDSDAESEDAEFDDVDGGVSSQKLVFGDLTETLGQLDVQDWVHNQKSTQQGQ